MLKMYGDSLITEGSDPAGDGFVDFSFSSPEGWSSQPFVAWGRFEGYEAWTEPGFVHLATLLIGDEEAGPMFALTATAPAEAPLTMFPAHGHDSDNWRVTLLGESAVGQDRYSEGAFRFQRGGKPYGGDNVACGPEGGWMVTMQGDRRGRAQRPVKEEFKAFCRQQAENSAKAFGFNIPDDYVVTPAVVTTLGELSRLGHVDGSFEDKGAWRELRTGVRLAGGLVGNPERGPAVVLLAGEPSTSVLGASEYGTEAFVMVNAGSCAIDGRRYEAGDCRIQLADTRLPEIVAGDEGVELAIVFGDRRGVPADGTGDLGAIVDELVHELPQDYVFS